MNITSFQLELTNEEYDAAVQKLTSMGLSPSFGTLPETDGVLLAYNAVGNNVTFTIVKKPFFISLGMIEDHVKQLLGMK